MSASCSPAGHPGSTPLLVLVQCSMRAAQPVRSMCARSEGTASLGLYSASINTVLYKSTSYFDDLAWGALWLHRLTGQAAYLDQVSLRVSRGGNGGSCCQP